MSTQDEIDQELAELEHETPRPNVGRRGRAYLIEVGDSAWVIGSAEFVGASYHDEMLNAQVGPVLMRLDFSEEAL